MKRTMLSLVGLALASLSYPLVAQTPAGLQRPAAPRPYPVPRLLAAATDDSVTGELLDVRGGPPWSTSVVAATAGGRRLRRFAGDAYVIHPEAGLVERVPLAGGRPVAFDLGPASEPQDVLLQPDPSGASAGHLLVTRRNGARLLRLDIDSGDEEELTDLAPVGGGAPIALGTMIADDGHLFVQVKVLGAAPGGNDAGLLAVLDRISLELVDVDPETPGVQGIALQGAPPQLPMQIVDRTLFVSATEGTVDGRGAIERVDLDTLTSIGFALSERLVGDLGGFVMTSAEEGYFVFHTDFAPSTHLNAFSIRGGPVFDEIVLLLGDTVDVLVHDAANERLYLPSGYADGPIGIHVVDTRTGEALPGGPILTDIRVHDVLLR